MKLDSSYLIGAAAVLGIGLIIVSTEGSGGEGDPAAPSVQEGAALPPGHPPLDDPAAGGAGSGSAGSGGAASGDPASGGVGSGGAESAGVLTRGTVQEAIPASRYVFLRVDVEGTPTWVATGAMAVSEGDEVVFGEGVVMRDFYSRTLDRTFDEILFAGTVLPVAAGPAIR